MKTPVRAAGYLYGRPTPASEAPVDQPASEGPAKLVAVEFENETTHDGKGRA